ncbi:MAG TPA: hypothetical protein VF796_19165 [Humisphaera sp.]
MFVYIGLKYTSLEIGDTMRQVTCASCGDVYYYKLYRQGTGTGRSPYFIDQEGAADRASRQAAARLARKLATGCDPVPCPTCGRYQPEMVTLLRRQRYQWVGVVGLVAPMVAFFAFVIWAARRHLEFERDPGVFAGGLLLPVALWAAIYGLRRLAEHRYDPHKTRPKFRRPPPKPLRLLNAPEEFSPNPKTDLYFTSPEDYARAAETGQQVPLEACWVQQAARAGS